jgi:hypothetical protein
LGKIVVAAGLVVVGAGRRAVAKIIVSREEEARTLVAILPASLPVALRVVRKREIIFAVGAAIVRAARRAEIEVDAGEEEALTLLAPVPALLAGARRGGKNVVPTADVGVRWAHTYIVSGIEEALALPAPVPPRYSTAGVRENIAKAGTVIVGAPRRANTEVVTREERPSAFPAHLPVALLRHFILTS